MTAKPVDRWGWHRPQTWLVLLVVLLAGIGVRAGYGLMKYQGDLRSTGDDFVRLWDYDALEHLLIAKGISERGEYVVQTIPGLENKRVRYLGQPAQYKAPLYQYLLAAATSWLGMGFPPIALLGVMAGGIATALGALLALRLSGRQSIAGLGAGALIAVHPILVNTAFQPYNENLFFCLLLALLLLYIAWLDAPRWPMAIAIGLVAGAGLLVRESLLAPFAGLLALCPIVASTAPRSQRLWHASLMLTAAIVVVAPWTAHNARQLGTPIPISSITGSVLGMGNNDCVGAEPIMAPFYGDRPCPTFQRRVTPLLAKNTGLPPVVARDRALAAGALHYIRENPGAYAKLVLRRSWTTFLPAHPVQQFSSLEAGVMTLYMTVTLIPGLAMLVVLAHRRKQEAWASAVVVIASFAPLALIFVSHDHRFRIGIDLVLAIYAGVAWSAMARQYWHKVAGAPAA